MTEKKETVLYVIGNYLYSGTNAISNLLISKMLGPAALGVISYFNAIATNLNSFVLGGIRSAVEREVPQIKEHDKKKEFAEKAYTLNFIFVVIFSILYVCIGFNSDNKMIEYSGYWMAGLSAFMGIVDFYRIWHKSLFHIGQISIIMIVSSIFLPFSVITCAYLYNYQGFWAGRILVQLLIAAILFFIVVRLGFRKINVQFIKAVFVSGGPIILFGLIQTIFQTADRFVIKSASTLEELGLYSLGAMVFTMLMLFPQSIVGSIFPRFVANSTEDRSKDIATKSLMLQLASLVISIAVIFILPYIIDYLLPEYHSSITVTNIFLIAFIMNSNTQFKYIDIIRKKRMKPLLISSFAALIIGLILFGSILILDNFSILKVASISVVNFSVLSILINVMWNKMYKKQKFSIIKDVIIQTILSLSIIPLIY